MLYVPPSFSSAAAGVLSRSIKNKGASSSSSSSGAGADTAPPFLLVLLSFFVLRVSPTAAVIVWMTVVSGQTPSSSSRAIAAADEARECLRLDRLVVTATTDAVAVSPVDLRRETILCLGLYVGMGKRLGPQKRLVVIIKIKMIPSKKMIRRRKLEHTRNYGIYVGLDYSLMLLDMDRVVSNVGG